MSTQEITVRVSKTIQEQQYEPLTVDLTVTEPCTKKKYGERMAELTDLLKEEAYAALGIETDQPTGEEEAQHEEEDGPLEESGKDPSEEGFEDPGEEGAEGQGEEGFEESGEFEGGEEGLEGGGEDEFGDFFEDDPD